MRPIRSWSWETMSMDPVMLARIMQGLAYSHVEDERLETMGQTVWSGQSITKFLAILIGCMMTEELGANYKNLLRAAYLLPSM